MKRIQKYLTMLSMICLILSLAACNNNDTQVEQQTTLAQVETKVNNSNSQDTKTEKVEEKETEAETKADVSKEIETENVIRENVVSNQESLENALASGEYDKVIIETSDKTKLEIPEGDYSKIELVVNTPNADIINNGSFNSITINQIATDTWTENTKGNVLIINAAAGHIVIPEDAELQEIQIKNANSTFVLDVKGSVATINVDADTTLQINVTGVVDKVNVNDTARINIDGKTSQNINVNVEGKADGTSITSNVTVNVTAVANTEVNIKKGAEGSTVVISDKEKVVEVTNTSSESIKITTEGINQTIDSNKNGTIDGNGIVTGSTTNGIGSNSDNTSETGSSGDSSDDIDYEPSKPDVEPIKPSGDITRKITSFEPISSVCAGTIGEVLISEDNIAFPKEVIGKASNGDKVTFPVVEWINDNNYSTSVGVGNYYYTAVLGKPVDSKIIYTIKDGVTARLRVYVKGASNVEYLNEGAVNVDVKFYDTNTAGISCMVLTNNNPYSVYVSGKIEYYDANGYLNAAVTKNIYADIRYGNEYSGYLMPGESYIETIDERNIVYEKRVVSLEAEDRSKYDERVQVMDKISITYKETDEAIEATITNTSGKQIGGVSISAIFFDENGKVIYDERYGKVEKYSSSSKVYGEGYTDTIKLGYVVKEEKYDTQTGKYIKTYYKPASYKVFLHGAIETEKAGAVPDDSIPENIDVKFYDTNTAGISCMVLTNNNPYSVYVSGKIEYYDANGYLNAAVTKNIYADIRYGNEYSGYLMPGESYIETIDERNIVYEKRVVSLEAEDRSKYDERVQVMDKISITYKETDEAIEATITNTSGKQIGGVSISAIFFDENGKVIYDERYGKVEKYSSSSKVYGEGYTDTIKLGYVVKEEKYDTQTGEYIKTYHKPTSYLVYTHGAIVSEKEPATNE